MASVPNQNTSAELAVRRALHRSGFRFRLHQRQLPGSPDLTFPRLRVALFVHGCFWHGHLCRWGRLPKSRREYWTTKILINKRRDRRSNSRLRRAGWTAVTVWQCELRNPEKSLARTVKLLDAAREAIGKPLPTLRGKVSMR